MKEIEAQDKVRDSETTESRGEIKVKGLVGVKD